MYLTDYHTHSLCSPDGKYPLTAMAQAAVDAGLAELCVTDHWDLVREMGDGLILDYDWTGVLEQVAWSWAAASALRSTPTPCSPRWTWTLSSAPSTT